MAFNRVPSMGSYLPPAPLQMRNPDNNNIVYLIPRGLVFPQNFQPSYRGEERSIRLNNAEGVLRVRLNSTNMITTEDEVHRYSMLNVDNDLVILHACFEGAFWKRVYFEGIEDVKAFMDDYVLYGNDKIRSISLEDLLPAYRSSRYVGKVKGYRVDLYDVLRNNPLYSPVFGIFKGDPCTIYTRQQVEYKTNKDNQSYYIDSQSEIHSFRSGKPTEACDLEMLEMEDIAEGIGFGVQGSAINTLFESHRDVLKTASEENHKAYCELADSIETKDDEFVQIFSSFPENGFLVLCNRFSKEIRLEEIKDQLIKTENHHTYYKSKDYEIVGVLARGFRPTLIVFTNDFDTLTAMFAMGDDSIRVHQLKDFSEMREVIKTPGLGVVSYNEYLFVVCFQPEAKNFEEVIFGYFKCLEEAGDLK